MNQYIITPHDTTPDWWIVRDTLNGVTIEWQQGFYNETQKVSCSELTLKGITDTSSLATHIARVLTGISDYLAIHHVDKVWNLSPRKLLGERIGQLRTYRGISIRDLAEQCELTPATIVNIQQGRFSPRYEIVEKIFSVLGAKIEIKIDED